MFRMVALGKLRERCQDLGTEVLIRATRGICHGSLMNADHGRADTRARLDAWSDVLPLYRPEPTQTSAHHPSRASA